MIETPYHFSIMKTEGIDDRHIEANFFSSLFFTIYVESRPHKERMPVIQPNSFILYFPACYFLKMRCSDVAGLISSLKSSLTGPSPLVALFNRQEVIVFVQVVQF